MRIAGCSGNGGVPRAGIFLGVMLVGLLALAPVLPVAAAPAGQPIRIGSTLALTGPLGPTALLHKIAGEIYVEELNRSNGLLGRPVEWMRARRPVQARRHAQPVREADHGRQGRPPDGALRHGRHPGRDGRRPALPEGASSTTRSACRISPSTRCTSRRRRSARSRTRPFPPPSSAALATAANPPKTVAIVTSKFPSAQFLSSGAKEVAEKRGLKVVLYLEYEFGTRDWGAIAARVKDAKPDLLWVGALGLDGNQLLEAMKKLDYMPPRHFHLFPAPGPLALSPDGKQALSVTVFEEHPPFMANPKTARLVSLLSRERATKANVPYPNVDTQAPDRSPPGRSSMRRSRRRRASTTRCSGSGCAPTRSTRSSASCGSTAPTTTATTCSS